MFSPIDFSKDANGRVGTNELHSALQHMIVLGRAGDGKTFLAGSLIDELRVYFRWTLGYIFIPRTSYEFNAVWIALFPEERVSVACVRTRACWHAPPIAVRTRHPSPCTRGCVDTPRVAMCLRGLRRSACSPTHQAST